MARLCLFLFSIVFPFKQFALSLSFCQLRIIIRMPYVGLKLFNLIKLMKLGHKIALKIALKCLRVISQES